MTATLPGLDTEELAKYLARNNPSVCHGSLTVRILSGGRSNLTYHVADEAGNECVLRRPPLGPGAATAHDMRREFRAIRALSSSVVPVPGPILQCTDPAIIGAPFYLMEYVQGTIFRTAQQAESLSTYAKTVLANNLIDRLADLHSIEPETVGLEDFGSPEGYLERQLGRWSSQVAGLPARHRRGLAHLHDLLAAKVPSSDRATILHGDYRLDNVVTSADLNIAAVLDWELATLGDPLADVGLFLAYWDGLSAIDNPILSAPGRGAGFPSGRELTERYAVRMQASMEDLQWYVGLGFFKIAVILEGIHVRFLRGHTFGPGFDQIGDLVGPLIEMGRGAAAERALET